MEWRRGVPFASHDRIYPFPVAVCPRTFWTFDTGRFWIVLRPSDVWPLHDERLMTMIAGNEPETFVAAFYFLFDARLALERRRTAKHPEDRKSTRLNSSHVKISYAVF